MRLLNSLLLLLLAGAASAQASLPTVAAELNIPADSVVMSFDDFAVVVGDEVEAMTTGAPIPERRWWALWRDGARAYNWFRDYRTSTDVWLYFSGYPGGHDCDARWIPAGATTQYRWCTRDAQWFARVHGGLVRVYRG